MSIGLAHEMPSARMSADPRAPSAAIAGAVCAAGAAATAVAFWAADQSPILVDAHSAAVARALFVASYIAVGTYTWRRRPAGRLGPLVISAGFYYAALSLNASGNPVLYTIGRTLLGGLAVYLIYLVVAFPRGRLGSVAERRFVSVFAVATAFAWALALALSQTLPRSGAFSDCGSRCPHNAFALVNTSPTVTDVVNAGVNVVAAVGVVWTVVLLLGKARSPSRLRRRAVAPLLAAFILLAISFFVYALLDEAHGATHRDVVVRVLTAASALAIPFALLIGQVRGRAFAVASLGQIVTRAGEEPISPARVEALLSDALGDPTAELALAVPGHPGYVDVHGDDLELPDDPLERSVVPVKRAGRAIAALIHDPEVVDDLPVVEALAATSLMLLENNRLVHELHASRSRIATVAGEERLRIERDLHDGAQQQLVAMQIRLALALERVHEPKLAADLQRIAHDAAVALEQLRELAHGIYPLILQESGVGPALRRAALELPLPVQVEDHGIGRHPPAVEAAIYFCALEALQNATKHAGRDARVRIILDRHPDEIGFEIADDGAGFEIDPDAPGAGLLNMQDRIRAIGGDLEIVTAPGSGTVVRGTVPVDHGPESTGGQAV